MIFNTRQEKAINATENQILCLSSAGSGKALPNSTIVPTPDGWKNVGEIKIGDYLFDRKGKPTKVLGVYPQGEKEVYEITFGDGRKAKCSKDHIWRIYCNNSKNRDAFKDLTVEEMLKKGILTIDKRGHSSAKFSIPCSEAIQMPEIDYDIHPYVIGAFLGDGCCKEKALTISSNDVEIVKKINSLIGNYGFKKLCQNNYSWSFYCEPHLSKTNKQILFYQTRDFFTPYTENICCMAYEKSIPEIYKKGSIEQRLQLLQGLFDTEGSITRSDGRYHVTFTSTSKKLIQDVKEVLGTLGYISSIREDKREEKYTKNVAYELKVNIPNKEKNKLFSLTRKKEIAMEAIDKKQHRNYDRTTIRSIKSLNYKEEMTCFYVDNEEHLFLMNDFIVTHNTSVLTERVRRLIAGGCKPQDIICITYTNMAADEMKKRLGDIAFGSYIGTIHGLANSVCIAARIDTSSMIANKDFDTLLKEALSIKRSLYPTVKHVLVDEFQDTCKIEYDFIKRINTENYFFVGDDRQSIYGFKGASTDFMREVYYDPSTRVYHLNQNYRCAPNIIRFAEDLIGSIEKMSMSTVPMKEKDGVVKRTTLSDAIEELEWYQNWSSWAILTRTNDESITIQEILNKKEIPNMAFKKGDLDLIEMNRLMTENKVKVLTIHSAKGLEFPNVIVCGAKNFNDEEKRIGYVAATRAKNMLFWTPSCCKRRKKQGGPTPASIVKQAKKNMISW